MQLKTYEMLRYFFFVSKFSFRGFNTFAFNQMNLIFKNMTAEPLSIIVTLKTYLFYIESVSLKVKNCA